MNVYLEHDGEKKRVTVGDSGQLYVGKEYAGKDVEFAIEVQSDE